MINYSSEHILGLGTSNIASLGRSMSYSEVNNLILAAKDCGISIIDTADTYGSGDAERMIGKAIKNNREDFFLMTKAGFPYCDLPKWTSPLNQVGKKVLQNLGLKQNFSADYLVNSLERSLKRLNTDYVDVFFLHEPNILDLERFSDTTEGLNLIKKRGMARKLGISTNDYKAFSFINDQIKLDFVQTQISFELPDEKNIVGICNLNGIPVFGNQIMKGLPALLNNTNFINIINSNGLSNNDVPSILIKYVNEILLYNTILLGSKNSLHLKYSSDFINFNSNDFKEVFYFMNSNILPSIKVKY